MSDKYKSIWETLNKVSMDKIKDKKGKFDYLSWTDMWQEIQKYFPEIDYEFKEFEHPQHGLMDCMVYPDGSASVHCTVTIQGVQRSMWLAVTDFNNNAKKDWNVVDVANTKMRCLTKCISMFGLGAHIYRGEDLVDRDAKPTKSVDVKSYILLGIDRKTAHTFHTTTDYIEAIRKAMADMEEEERVELFSVNTKAIESAYNDVAEDDDNKSAYEKMIDLYGK